MKIFTGGCRKVLTRKQELSKMRMEVYRMQENLGEMICRYRQMRKLTQNEFALRLGVTPQAVSRWERGSGLPDVSLIEGICSILGISANTLLNIDSKMVENGNAAAESEIRNNMFAEPLLLEFGEAVIPCVVEGLKTNYVNEKRKELVKQTGMLMPVLRIRDSLDMEKDAYRIMSYDKVLSEGRLEKLDDADYRHMIDRAAICCEENYASIINKQIVKIMIDNLKELFPGVADDLVPDKISYLQVERKLQAMIQEGKSIRNLIHILEEMEEGM